MKLIFVYNANSGIFSALTDTFHKTVSPDTYACNLCRVTYGPLSMKDEWREYVTSLPHEIIFMHRDEFWKQHPEIRKERLPAVFAVGEAGIETIIPSSAINAADSVQDLMSLVSQSINNDTQQSI
ncbi:hypothetical protein COU20_02520 [Candidatus Kaiserbacteria bacterium CG10_big_fil_rev_8_21_14_0_10_59_10]|uniref:GTPase n=1 Tax=Candidatus Kaiserbacteria bacterium CG10_big_fil_rev_8_21_14_0_10_59_10 TaxID=1974612 RepID=A0A2H0U7H7_9BACT|nr:MAG: hypothetical protein COU20_02520 [Candidatus Kaiserbacteria bacterium CG10_big_fil_rev_8_21_14_0_10_59_10]